VQHNIQFYVNKFSRATARTCGLSEGFECDASETATNYLKSKCNGQRKCLVQNDPAILDANKKSSCGDSLQKYLLLNYVCSPEASRSNTESEFKFFIHPPPHSNIFFIEYISRLK